jgi:hypothetical protein
MANPTTNYGFVLPTPTDLVTDLPADFDVALQGVDTRLKALQPGTTLGDIAYSSATANTNTRLAIGTTGQILTVAGGVPSWGAAPTSGGMTLINSGGTALSGSSTTVTITGTYVNIFAVWAGVTGSADADFRIRFNGVTSANSHLDARVRNRNGTLTGGLGNDDSFTTLGSICTTAGFLTSGRGNIIINNASETQFQSMPYIHYASDDGSNAGRCCFQGTAGFNSAAAITSLTWLASGGTFTAGTVYVYGVK